MDHKISCVIRPPIQNNDRKKFVSCLVNLNTARVGINKTTYELLMMIFSSGLPYHKSDKNLSAWLFIAKAPLS